MRRYGAHVFLCVWWISCRPADMIFVCHPNCNYYHVQQAGGFLGWAYLPWQYTEGSKFQVMVIHPNTFPGGSMRGLNKGHTAVHEMGHYLGLSHTFNTDGSCSIESGDSVSDTPLQARPNYGCSHSKDTCPNHAGFDPVWNFMDYSPDACMTRFSPGQAVRMREMIDTWRSIFVAKSTVPQVVTNPCQNETDADLCFGRGRRAAIGDSCSCVGCVNMFKVSVACLSVLGSKSQDEPSSLHDLQHSPSSFVLRHHASFPLSCLVYAHGVFLILKLDGTLCN
jgi:hypothetical protein